MDHRMTMQRLLVRLTALIFVLYGVGFIVAPALLSQYVTGAVPASASGLIDMRATYGGMSLAIGLLLLHLSRQSTPRTGLLGVLLLMLGMAGGRVCGMLVDGAANPVMQVYLALEIIAALAAAALLARG